MWVAPESVSGAASKCRFEVIPGIPQVGSYRPFDDIVQVLSAVMEWSQPSHSPSSLAIARPSRASWVELTRPWRGTFTAKHIVDETCFPGGAGGAPGVHPGAMGSGGGGDRAGATGCGGGRKWRPRWGSWRETGGCLRQMQAQLKRSAALAEGTSSPLNVALESYVLRTIRARVFLTVDEEPTLVDLEMDRAEHGPCCQDRRLDRTYTLTDRLIAQ